MSFFNTLDLLPDDSILSIPPLFAADKRSEKVDLSIGTYHDDLGKLPVLKSIRRAEDIVHEKHPDKKYQPIDGNPEYVRATVELLFGERAIIETIYAAQSIGGTSALRIIGDLLARSGNYDIFIPNPSWSNHKLIFTEAKMNIYDYPYYNPETHAFEFEQMCAAIENMNSGSVILLHSCCHNPTGVDPTFEQWIELSKRILRQKLIVVFDCAYQGLGTDIDTDVEPIRYFHAQGHEMAIAYSFSKNLGLYGERVGLLAISTPHRRTLGPIASQVKQIIRSIYSNPPLHGGRLALTVLKTPAIKHQWLQELAGMQKRIETMRKALAEGLSKATSQDFSFLVQQKGLFSFCGLTTDQVMQLRNQYAIYMPANGRMNVAGLNFHNLDYVIESICATMYL